MSQLPRSSRKKRAYEGKEKTIGSIPYALSSGGGPIRLERPPHRTGASLAAHGSASPGGAPSGVGFHSFSRGISRSDHEPSAYPLRTRQRSLSDSNISNHFQSQQFRDVPNDLTREEQRPPPYYSNGGGPQDEYGDRGVATPNHPDSHVLSSPSEGGDEEEFGDEDDADSSCDCDCPHHRNRHGHHGDEEEVTGVMSPKSRWPSQKKRKADNALSAAVRGDHWETAKALLDAGADVQSRIECGLTPFMVAAEYGSMKCLQLLLDYGADVNVCDHSNQSALHRALQHKQQGAASFISKNGGKPCARGRCHKCRLGLKLIARKEQEKKASFIKSQNKKKIKNGVTKTPTKDPHEELGEIDFQAELERARAEIESYTIGKELQNDKRKNKRKKKRGGKKKSAKKK